VITVKNEKFQEEFGSRSKIKTLKFLDEESFISGTDTGILELHAVRFQVEPTELIKLD